MKYLILILVIGLVLWLMFGKSRRTEQVRQREEEQKTPRLPAQMVRCAHCGVHLPAAEALTDAAGRHYCGEAHRKAGPRDAA